MANTHQQTPILPALVGQGGNLAASPMRRHCLPNQKVQIKEIRRRKMNRVNPALPPAQPADALAPRALLLRPRLSTLRLCLLHRDLSAYVRSPEELEDRLAAPLVREHFRHLPPALPALCVLLHFCPHRLLLGSPSGAVLEQLIVLPGATPLALVGLPQFDPRQVSSRKGVPCF